jgi:hypothetical protein
MTQRTRRTVGIAANVLTLTSVLVACGDDAETPGSSSSTLPSPDVSPYFSDTFDDDSNGWGVIDHPEYGTASFEGGDYVWSLTGRIAHLVPETMLTPIEAGELTLADVVVDATVTIEAGDGVAGVFCRETPDTDAEFQWYEFVVRAEYAAIRLTDIESNIEVLAEDKEFSSTPGEQLRITGTCVGDSLSMAVNGEPVLQADDDTLSEGATGIEAFTFPIHAQMDLRWHDFSVAKS